MTCVQPPSGAQTRWPQMAQLWEFRAEWCLQAVGLLVSLGPVWGVCSWASHHFLGGSCHTSVSSLGNGVASVRLVKLTGIWKVCPQVGKSDHWGYKCLQNPTSLREEGEHVGTCLSLPGESLSLSQWERSKDWQSQSLLTWGKFAVTCTAQREVESWQMRHSDSETIRCWRDSREYMSWPLYFRSVLLDFQTGIFFFFVFIFLTLA